ncbi:DUF488 domain-containing protein [Antricoccus suffuscus]|nr:DUF488 family protein [Antricoccus suffuscus]
MTFQIKRVYDDAERADGARVLVDRLWPRGIKKEALGLELWCKDIAPSADLRAWFDHRADRFGEFTKRYTAELDENSAVDDLLELESQKKTVTLLYGAKDRELNQAVVLKDYLESARK